MTLPPRDERGAGMVMVLAVVAIFTALGLAGASLAMTTRRGSDGQRAAVTSISAAEAGVDVTYQLLKAGVPSAGCTQTGGRSVWTLPSTTLPGGRPVDASYSGRVIFYDSTGATGTAAACSSPQQAVIQSVGVYNGQTGLSAAANRRGMESLVNLQPIVNGGVGAAIYSKGAIPVANNFNLYGSDTSINDANIVVENGNFGCSNNKPLASGSVTVPRGGIVTSGGCKPDIRGNVSVRDSISNPGGSQLFVSGNVFVSEGSVAACDAVIGGRLTIPTGPPPSSCAAAQGWAAAPVTLPTETLFPNITYVAADWASAGYATQNVASGCPTQGAIQGVTGRTVFNAPSCNLALDNTTITLSGDVAIFARSFDLEKNDWAASSARKLHLIVPSPGPTPQVGCDITSGNNTGFSTSIAVFMYTPCPVSFSNSTTIYGQIYGGSVTSSNQLNLYFSPPGVPGVALAGGPPQSTGTYNVNVVYKRESSTSGS